MKTGSGDNRCVGEVKVLEIAAVVSVAVRTVGANRRRSGSLLAVSGAFCQSSCPARIESESRKGGVHVSGSSCVNASGPRTLLESPVRRLKARTRKPLTTPSEWLKRNRIVLAPSTTARGGSGSVTLQRGETPAYSAIALARLRDGDRVVVQRQPGARVDLHAHHVGVAQTVDLHPQRPNLAARPAGTSTVTLDVVPFSPTTSTGRVTAAARVSRTRKDGRGDTRRRHVPTVACRRTLAWLCYCFFGVLSAVRRYTVSKPGLLQVTPLDALGRRRTHRARGVNSGPESSSADWWRHSFR